MASTQALSNAAQDRKARLAQLKSLKRKAPNTQEEIGEDVSQSVSEEPSTAAKPAYLSGRNYDIESKGVKLGFEHAPSEGQNTLERQAAALSEEAQRQAAKEQQEDKPLDLFKLQPKKPNWDLKRDLDRKLDVLKVRMDNAIARLVRDRIAVQQKLAKAEAGISGTAGSVNRGASQGDGEAAGIEGTALVEAMNVKEREVEEDMRREREEDAALLDES
nr:pre-mRNA-splicing factor cwf18-like [Quercus suber]POF16369.1 pre-mrna-splicing factor cwf18 [Quercus suber]